VVQIVLYRRGQATKELGLGTKTLSQSVRGFMKQQKLRLGQVIQKMEGLLTGETERG